LKIRPGHYSAAEYYAAPSDNFRTYPVYRPDKEPPGYWEWLQKQKPEPLVDATRIRNRQDWIAADARAFREMDDPTTREVLYAIGAYLLSLTPPKNPNPPPADLVNRGEQVFRREKCGSCHPKPNYTTGELTPATGFDVPFGRPNVGDVRDRSVGTDPGLALRTRKDTGVYKIPSLRGLWYRPRLLHDASIVTLEEFFDAARLDPEYERKGWSPPGVTRAAVPGLEFLVKLSADDNRALIAFLRSR
jgi:hypothetical protein